MCCKQRSELYLLVSKVFSRRSSVQDLNLLRWFSLLLVVRIPVYSLFFLFG